MSGRRVHAPSGRVYHVKFNPPKNQGKDDETGEELIQRDDDKEGTVRDRLAVYRRQTLPLVEYYEDKAKGGSLRFARVDGRGAVNDVQSRMLAALRSR
jgi:adenylate kinase